MSSDNWSSRRWEPLLVQDLGGQNGGKPKAPSKGAETRRFCSLVFLSGWFATPKVRSAHVANRYNVAVSLTPKFNAVRLSKPTVASAGNLERT
eukprot:931175-Prorocentrum_minimum.AAC.2